MNKVKWALAAAVCMAPAVWAADAVDPKLYLDDIKFLAGPEMRGRATGSPELERAAAFIAGKFREFGLKPVDGKSYYQAFPVTTDARLGKANQLQFSQGGRTTVLRPGDFTPFKFSSAGKISGAVVFAGYGITAPEYHYDDYEGIDAKGKIVLILRHEPQEFDEHSVFDGRNFTDHAKFFSKAANAKMHGAAAVILVNDRANHKSEADDLEKFSKDDGPRDAGMIFLQVKEEKIDGWFAAAGKSLDAIQAAIDKDLKPQAFAFPASIAVEGRVDLERAVKTVHNVAGYLPGQTDEYVIVGAHYDHLGLGEQFSMAPSLAGTTVHPGADDNASGTAGVIELARWFSKQPKQKRGILFLTFAGEELGLLGSEYYVGHPDLPLAKAAAMINMDMIGRVRDAKVYIGGSATGTGFRELLDRVTPKYNLKTDYADTSGYGASDHTSFTTGRVPVLFFFSGLHSDYHKPSDTWDKIDAPDAAKLLDLVAEVADDLRQAAERPQYVRVAPVASAHGDGSVGPVSGSTQSGYGPYFGSIPDFADGIKGVKFSDVRDGSPASKAGLKGGDILVEWDGKAIENLYDFTYALRGKKPGDNVRVKVMRDGKPVEADVLLTKRD